MAIGPFRSYNLAGLWMAETGEGEQYSMRLPGTLDDNNIGNAEMEENRLSRRYSYTGPVVFKKNLPFRESDGKRYFLEFERTREIRVFLDEKEMLPYAPLTLVTPAVFEITGHLSGALQVTVQSTNSYEQFPGEVYESNMASADTQTNWNGILGYMRIREEEDAFIEKALLKKKEGNRVSLILEIHRKKTEKAFLKVHSELFKTPLEREVELPREVNPVVLEDLELKENAQCWSPENPRLYSAFLILNGVKKEMPLALREISASEEGKVLLNGIPQWIQGETNEAIFPETIYPPMEKKDWKELFTKYCSFHLSCVYFRAYCPPEEAFLAADELGLLLMPEISLAEPVNRILNGSSRDYYKTEVSRILKEYGHHPSFVFLSLGADHPYREMNAEKKSPAEFETVDLSLNAESAQEDSVTREFFTLCKSRDDTRLYVLNGQVLHGIEGAMAPSFALALGKTDLLPDLTEADLYGERLLGYNYEEFRRRAVTFRLLQHYKESYRSSFLHTMEIYEDRIDQVLCANVKNGFFLLGLQDMPGFGTHTHGLLNASMVEKNLVKEFKYTIGAFFNNRKLIVLLEKNIFDPEEGLSFDIYCKNDTEEEMNFPLTVQVLQGEYLKKETLPAVKAVKRYTSHLHRVKIPFSELPSVTESAVFEIQVTYGPFSKVKKAAAFSSEKPVCPASVKEASYLSPAALEWLENGGNLLLSPRALPRERSAQDLICREDHPVFRFFPEEKGDTNLLKRLVNCQSAILPKTARVILMPFFGNSKNAQALMLEFRLNGGNVFFTTLGLRERQDLPEDRALLKGIYTYMDSYDFNPKDEFSLSQAEKLMESLEGEEIEL